MTQEDELIHCRDCRWPGECLKTKTCRLHQPSPQSSKEQVSEADYLQKLRDAHPMKRFREALGRIASKTYGCCGADRIAREALEGSGSTVTKPFPCYHSHENWIVKNGWWTCRLCGPGSDIEGPETPGPAVETPAEPTDSRDRIEQCVREIQQICDWCNLDPTEWLNDETAIGEKPRERPQPIATVINNNQPGWTNIIETAPNVTLPVGTKLYDQAALLAVGARVVDDIWQRDSSEKTACSGCDMGLPLSGAEHLGPSGEPVGICERARSRDTRSKEP